ncbi:MAG TPA: response regulator transcription factor [Kofleriaceae bacterium]|jgi:DNA-binding NarL/FixJ family response regulator
MTTCLLADDHEALRIAISSYLTAAGYDVIGPAVDGKDAIEIAGVCTPDVAVVDYRMPRASGAALVRALGAASPVTRIVVYTADADTDLAREALDAGAAAVVLKQAPLADLGRALQTVLAGMTYLDPTLAPDASTPRLTERELEVLRLLADGLQHEAIGERLGIGSETVRTHLRKACGRLGAATRTHAVASALRAGLIT